MNLSGDGNPYGASSCVNHPMDSRSPIKVLGGRLRHGNDNRLCRSRENGNPYGGSTCSYRKLDSRFHENDNLSVCTGMTARVGSSFRSICLKVVPLPSDTSTAFVLRQLMAPARPMRGSPLAVAPLMLAANAGINVFGVTLRLRTSCKLEGNAGAALLCSGARAADNSSPWGQYG